MSARDYLTALLTNIETNDVNYELRNRLIFAAVGQALYLGFAAGIRLDPSEPEWPVAYIELPTGQVSWHLPQHPKPWDGHDTPEKYRRCRAFVGDA